MPSKSLRKIEKTIVKKRGKLPALHENSRDSQRLRRASARDEKLLKIAATKTSSCQPLLERVAFFQQVAETFDEPLAEDLMQLITRRYIERNDDEVTQLQEERRHGRPSSNRQDLLLQRRAREEKEYLSGLWIPDFRDVNTVSRLKTWKGNWASLNALNWCRVAQDGAVKESKFPPRGE